MKEVQILIDLSKYLNSQCEYINLSSNRKVKARLTAVCLSNKSVETTYKRKKKGVAGDYIGIVGNNNLRDLKFVLDLEPISSLTQEDFDKMWVGVNGDAKGIGFYQFKQWYVDQKLPIRFGYADWLRNNGYYLGEESIEQFVKLPAKLITMKCRGCKKEHEVTRDSTAPADADYMCCNWCPACEDSVSDVYDEWYVNEIDLKLLKPNK